MTSSVRWTIKVSDATNLALRRILSERGRKKGDLSRFVEAAVQWRVFDCDVQALKDRNQDISYETLQEEVDRAVEEARKSAADLPARQ